MILRILHYRLLLAAGDPSYRLILEAYHPSRRYTRPYLFCTYLGTDGLSSKEEGVGAFYEDFCGDGEDTGHLGKLGGLYSSFRPEHPDVEANIPMRRIAGATPVLAQTSAVDGGDGSIATNDAGIAGAAAPPTTPIYKNTGDGGVRKIMYTINLDEGELFGQFCVYAQLVSGWKRRGIFDAAVNVVEPGQGTIRIWRQWLVERCQVSYERRKAEEGQQQLGESPPGEALTRSNTFKCPTVKSDPDIMWTDYKKNVGLKVEVRHRNPTAYMKTEAQLDEDALSCDLIIQGTYPLPIHTFSEDLFVYILLCVCELCFS